MEKIRKHLQYLCIGDEAMLDIPNCSSIRLAIKRTEQDRYEVRQIYRHEALWHFSLTVYVVIGFETLMGRISYWF